MRRPIGERCCHRYITPTVKHGEGSVMVYADFFCKLIEQILKINKIKTSEIYRDMTANKVFPLADKNFSMRSILQHNDPKHTTGIVKLGYQKHKVRLLRWSSHSP